MNTRTPRSRDMSIPALALSIPIRIYRIVAIPFTSGHCRFHPTCSVYALEALHRHGAIKGTWLTTRRISRCHPWGGSGIDEVPE